jgi:23S rRNA (guanine1835-N2)-methyltransferase
MQSVNSSLKRYPSHKHDPLQAWDSADDLLLQEMGRYQESGALAGKRILIVNDSFGALGCALLGQAITSYTDSYVSARAASINSGGKVPLIHRLEDLQGPYDFVLLRIPKNMSSFEDLLCHIRQHLHAGSKLISGYMLKHQADSAFELLNRLIGETRTSLAQKKARLIFCDFQKATADVTNPYPISVSIPGFEIPFVHHSNLFSREKLDIGTRFFLEHLPPGGFQRVLDLGCANGVIGIAAKKLNPGAEIIFADDSAMAVESAQANFENHFPGESAQFLWTNCYENQKPGSLDLVLCNPPFHQGNTLGDFIARQMFKDAHHALAPGGLLRVIGNTHLHYERLLDRLFGNTEIVARNTKFTIMDAVK